MDKVVNWFGKGLTNIDKRFTDKDGVVDYKAIYEKHQTLKKWYDVDNVSEFSPHHNDRGTTMFYFSNDTYRAASDAGWEAVFNMTEEDKKNRLQVSVFLDAMNAYMYKHCMCEDPFNDRPDAYQLVKMYE